MVTLALACATFPAAAQDVSCRFTLLCSRATGCQDHGGVDLTFDRISGTLGLWSNGTMILATPLSGTAYLFELSPGDLALLSLAADGAAAMSQHRTLPNGSVQAILYDGICTAQM